MITKQVRFYVARELLFHKIFNNKDCLKKSYILDENYLKCEFFNGANQFIDKENPPKFYVEITTTENETTNKNESFEFSLDLYKVTDVSFETNVMFLELLESLSKEDVFYIQGKITNPHSSTLQKDLTLLNPSLTKHSILFLINHFKENEKAKKKEEVSLDETNNKNEIIKLKRQIKKLEKSLKSAESEIEYLEIDLEFAEQDIFDLKELLESTVNDFNTFIQLNKDKYPDIMDFNTFSKLNHPYVVYCTIQ